MSAPHTVLKDTLASVLSAHQTIATALTASPTIGSLIREYRRENQISQTSLAKRLSISKSFLCDIESGKRSMSPEVIHRFLELL